MLFFRFDNGPKLFVSYDYHYGFVFYLAAMVFKGNAAKI